MLLIFNVYEGVLYESLKYTEKEKKHEKTHSENHRIPDDAGDAYGDYAVATYIGTQALASRAQLQNKNTVLYTGAFGVDTAVRYTADFSGYKEDVILYSSSAPTSFTFLLRPAGLVPVAENGVIRYQDKDTGETVLTTSPFYIYDSAENPNSYIDTDFSLEELTGGIYVLTVTLDAAYLATEGLTYPIYVDPSVYYASTGDVETATVYSGEPDTTSTMYDYLGYRGSTYGEARMLVRLNALKNNVIFRSLTEAQVTSVTLNMCLAGGGNGEGLLLMYRFTGSDDWEPGTARWSDVSATSFAMPYAGAMISPESNTSGIYNLDITNIAECWLGLGNASTTTASQGLIMINNYATSSEYTRCFYSAQSFTGVLPTVTVTYTPVIEDGIYFIRNMGTGTCMSPSAVEEESSIITNDFLSNTIGRWEISLQSSGYYKLKSIAGEFYLGIPANDIEGEGTVTLHTSTSRGTQWAIIPGNNGQFTLMANPVASRSEGEITKVLGVNPSVGSVGQFEESLSLYTKWELSKYNYILNIELMYEEAFANRFENPISKIENAMSVAQEKFLTEFGVLIEYSAPVRFKSLGDECNDLMDDDDIPAGMHDYKMGCPHYDETECVNSSDDTICEAHHKNLYNIVYNVVDTKGKPDLSVSIRILFLGNDVCMIGSDGHRGRGNGMYWYESGMIAITNFEDDERKFAKTVLHEIGHLYSAPDHHGYNGIISSEEMNEKEGKEIFFDDCIYGGEIFKDTLLDNLPICEGCREKILENITRFNHA